MGEMNDFNAMNSLWCLVYVIATNADGSHEPHILSCYIRDQTGHYYLIESATREVLMFGFPYLVHLDNHLFMEQGRLNPIGKLREYRSFANISPTHVNGEDAHLVIVPKNCLKPPCEEYSTMEVSILNMHFSNLPMLDWTNALNDTQPFQCLLSMHTMAL